jgi:hypothetical protein
MHEELKKSWYICTTLCKENYYEIINSIPEQWSINKHLLVNQINSFMMQEDWFNICWETYLEFLQRTKNRKHGNFL